MTEEYTNGEDQHSRSNTDAEAQPQCQTDVHQDAVSDDDDDTDDESDVQSIDALEDQFLLLEEEVATLVADVHDLALFTKLNITGFMKILKVCSSITCRLDVSHFPLTYRNMTSVITI